jgi:hypothetical protein
MAKDAILEQQGILPILKSLSNKESFQSWNLKVVKNPSILEILNSYLCRRLRYFESMKETKIQPYLGKKNRIWIFSRVNCTAFSILDFSPSSELRLNWFQLGWMRNSIIYNFHEEQIFQFWLLLGQNGPAIWP